MTTSIKRRYNFVLRDVPNRKEMLLKNYFGDKFEFGRENYLLSEIDKFTLNYNNKEELADDIKQIYGYDVPHNKFYIKYKENKEERYLKIAYKDLEILRQYAEISKTKIDIGPEYKKFYNHFMINISKGRFYRYMVDNNYINTRLHKLVDEYIYESKIYREKEIYEHLRNYRVIRDYIFGITEYNKQNINETAKISFDSIKGKVLKEENIDSPIIKKTSVKLSTDDSFLNSLTDRDDIAKYYDLDQLSIFDIEEPIFDGLTKSEKTKKLVLKKKE
ncbi:MAG: hypothetical protein PHW32_02035 [Bacilli bacterium]|nr:hypothetical protein [Bacilli bacterium]MDD4282245.1 hypothetical protein [Bacilli bacterium]MDD4718625.1 hypothetical protein [Bacilli bacterium]